MAAANGKLHFEASGKSFVLAYDINALCRVEDALGIEDVKQLQEVMSKGMSFRKLRTLFCCGLTPEVTEVEAGEVIQELGVTDATAKIGEAFKAAFPTAKGTTGNPR